MSNYCDFAPYIERQINARLNRLFDLHNQTTAYITEKFAAIDKTLENLVEKVEFITKVVDEQNKRLNKTEESVGQINDFVGNLGKSLPRQFLQTYMLCKEEIEDVKITSFVAIENIKQTVSSFTPKLLAINYNAKHICIITPESYDDIMNERNIEKHVKIQKDLPMTLENCHFICPNWNYNILTTNGSHPCDPIGLTFEEFISNYSKNRNKEYIHKNMPDIKYIKECLKGNVLYREDMLQQFTKFYQLAILGDVEFISTVADDIDQLMNFLRYICSTYKVYRIDNYVITIL